MKNWRGTNEEMSLFPLLTSQEEEVSSLAHLFWQKPVTQNLLVPFQNWGADVHWLSQLLAIFPCSKARYKSFGQVNTFSLFKNRNKHFIFQFEMNALSGIFKKIPKGCLKYIEECLWRWKELQQKGKGLSLLKRRAGSSAPAVTAHLPHPPLLRYF